jgi:hypothetical protein
MRSASAVPAGLTAFRFASPGVRVALVLSVSEDVPPLSEMRDFPQVLERLSLDDLRIFLSQWERRADELTDSRATDWSRIEQRMAYIVGLFRRFHTDPSVIAAPYPELAEGKVSDQTLPQ